MLPSLFIGSSTEGLPIAEHVQLGLEGSVECTIWSQGVFGLSAGTLETLTQVAPAFDFAALVLTPDDVVRKRGKKGNSPRDNVLFEAGLFMGTLGRERTFLVYARDRSINLPTDLAGINTANYTHHRNDGNLEAALGPLCLRLKTSIKTQGRRSLTTGKVSGSRLQDELKWVRTRMEKQDRAIKSIMKAMTDPRARARRDSSRADLRLLEGVWVGEPTGSTGWCRMHRGKIRFPYCYAGNNSVTAEFYNWSLVEGAYLGRFRWLDNSGIEGYGCFRLETDHTLNGGWWFSDDVPLEAISRLPNLPGMNPLIWRKKTSSTRFPTFVEKYYALAYAQ